MPYITNDKRQKLDESINSLVQSILGADGDNRDTLPGLLNYCITRVIKDSYKILAARKTGSGMMSYCDHNAAIGLLECAKQEFYRRQTAPYEDQKIKENGDV
jgi:hypothetical protein